MINSVTQWLDRSAERYPDKAAFIDETEEMTFAALREEATAMASALCRCGIQKSPVVVYLDKSAKCVSAMMGVAYSRNFYSIIDVHMPVARISRIITTLSPKAIITDAAHASAAKEFCADAELIVYETAVSAPVDRVAVDEAKRKIVDTDVLFVLFTSGSTGNPKGVIISHRAVISYSEWLRDTFPIDASSVFGNQTPFYFVMSCLDVYQTLLNGATTVIIPKSAFTLPVSLLDFLAAHRINTLYWVPTAVCGLTNFGALSYRHLDDLRLVMFSGEVMPTKQLNMWMDEYPEVMFVNQYGPTEMTDICAYYVVNRRIPNNEPIPIGRPARHFDLLLLDESNHEVAPGEIGEICGRGSSLAYGYYNDLQKTEEAFAQNPLVSGYSEKIYRTGDLAKVNEYGELVYVSRKDYQIKHLGNRIELGEIETAVSALDGVERCCCLHLVEKDELVLFYLGKLDGKSLLSSLRSSLPDYMIPNRVKQLDAMPVNLNGKIDRQKLKEMLA